MGSLLLIGENRRIYTDCYDLLERSYGNMEYNDIEVGEYEFHENTHAYTSNYFL